MADRLFSEHFLKEGFEKMMKRIFLLGLGACALAVNAKANVDKRGALLFGDMEAESRYSVYHETDPEHISDADEIIWSFQGHAVVNGATTPEEIDQFTHIAWHEMYLKLKLLLSVQGHQPSKPQDADPAPLDPDGPVQ
jgi:hypothetical protein